MKRIAFLVLAVLTGVPRCDDGGLGPDRSPRLSGQWTYSATNLQGASVTCSSSSLRLTLIQSASIEVDAYFTGSTVDFEIECNRDDRKATLFFPEGTAVKNGAVEDGVVAFDFEQPDFIHTGTLQDGVMSGTVATRLDLTGTVLGDLGVVNLVGDWHATRR